MARGGLHARASIRSECPLATPAPYLSPGMFRPAHRTHTNAWLIFTRVSVIIWKDSSDQLSYNVGGAIRNFPEVSPEKVC